MGKYRNIDGDLKIGKLRIPSPAQISECRFALTAFQREFFTFWERIDDHASMCDVLQHYSRAASGISRESYAPLALALAWRATSISQDHYGINGAKLSDFVISSEVIADHWNIAVTYLPEVLDSSLDDLKLYVSIPLGKSTSPSDVLIVMRRYVDQGWEDQPELPGLGLNGLLHSFVVACRDIKQRYDQAHPALTGKPDRKVVSHDPNPLAVGIYTVPKSTLLRRIKKESRFYHPSLEYTTSFHREVHVFVDERTQSLPFDMLGVSPVTHAIVRYQKSLYLVAKNLLTSIGQ